MKNPLRRMLSGGEVRSSAHNWMSLIGPSIGNRSAAGKHVSPDSALQISAVWGCVRVISDSVSTLPMDSFIREGGVRRGYLRPDWMRFEVGPWTKIDVISQALVSLLLHGNAYIATYRNDEGRVIYMEVLDPNAVSVVARQGEQFYKITTTKGTNEATRNDVLHIRGMTLPGQLEGVSPITYCRETIGVSLAAQEYGASFFGNGALPLAVVETDRAMSPTGVKTMVDGWDAIHQGTSNANKLAVLTEGAKLNKVSISPDDAQFLQTRAFQVNEVARIFGVPVNLLQHSEGPELGQTLSDKNIHFVQHTLRPWIERLELAFSWLMWSEGQTRRSFIKLNIDGLQRGDHATRFQTYSNAVIQGIMTVNEVRALEDLPPVPWGDKPISVQVNDQGSPSTEPANPNDEPASSDDPEGEDS